MNSLATLFPHLDPDASFTIQQAAGDRMRAIYTADAGARQAAAIGPENVHLTRTAVMISPSKGCYMVGLDHAFMMGRAMIVHRAMARTFPESRRHHVQNALRLRDSLCWFGLDEKMRKNT